MAYLKTRGTRLHTAWGDLGRPARTLLAGRLQPVPECRVSPRVGFGPTLRPSYFPLHAGRPAEIRPSKGRSPVHAPGNWAGASSAPALRALTGDGTRGRALATGGHWAQRTWLRTTWPDAPAQLLPPPRRHNRGYPGFLGPGDLSPPRVTGLERRPPRHFGRRRREGTRGQALATRRAETAISRARTSTRPPACRRPCRGPRGV